MKVYELMITNVSCCQMNQNLGEITALLWNGRRGSLPVLDEHGKVASLITDRDVCIALGTRDARPGDIRVRDVVLPRVFTCTPEQDVFDALNTMVTQNVRRLPVVDQQGGPVGMLSIDDVVRRAALQLPGDELLHDAVMRALKTICESREPGAAHPPAEVLVMTA